MQFVLFDVPSASTNLSDAQITRAQLDPMLHVLLRIQYTGVLTLEVFGEQDFESSYTALAASIVRCHAAAYASA